MKKLSVYIEINGTSEYVGEIAGSDFNDACFTYAESRNDECKYAQIAKQ